MKTLMLEGGWPMWFTLLFGGLALLSAVIYAGFKRGHLGTIVALGTATAFTSLMGICADLAAVGHHLSEHWDDVGRVIPRDAAQGFAESMSPGIVGFTFVALTAFVTAVGFSRRSSST